MYSTRLPAARRAGPRASITAAPQRPATTITVRPLPASVGAPVGPMSTSGSPGRRCSASRPPTPPRSTNSRSMSPSAPAPDTVCSGSCSRVPSATGLWASKLCMRKKCPGRKRRAAMGAVTRSSTTAGCLASTPATRGASRYSSRARKAA